jgi:hypothetical protein
MALCMRALLCQSTHFRVSHSTRAGFEGPWTLMTSVLERPMMLSARAFSLVTARAGLCLKPERRHAVGMAGHDVRRKKPCPQRQMAGMRGTIQERTHPAMPNIQHLAGPA